MLPFVVFHHRATGHFLSEQASRECHWPCQTRKQDGPWVFFLIAGADLEANRRKRLAARHAEIWSAPGKVHEPYRTTLREDHALPRTRRSRSSFSPPGCERGNILDAEPDGPFARTLSEPLAGIQAHRGCPSRGSSCANLMALHHASSGMMFSSSTRKLRDIPWPSPRA